MTPQEATALRAGMAALKRNAEESTAELARIKRELGGALDQARQSANSTIAALAAVEQLDERLKAVEHAQASLRAAVLVFADEVDRVAPLKPPPKGST